MVDSNSTVYGFVLNDKYFYSVKSNKNTIKINDKNQLEYVKYSFDSNDKYKATKVYSDYNNTVIEVPFDNLLVINKPLGLIFFYHNHLGNYYKLHLF